MIRTIFICFQLIILFSISVFGQEEKILYTYDWPTGNDEALLSDFYKVTLSVNDSTVNSEVIMSKPRESEIGDWAKEFRGGRTFNWTSFSYDFKEPITVTVEKLFGEGTEYVETFPSYFDIENEVSEDQMKVSFTLSSSKYVSVNFKSPDNMHTSDGVIKHMLMIFADSLETDIPLKEDDGVYVYNESSSLSDLKAANTIYFPRGYHNLDDVVGEYGNLAPAINKVGKRIYFEGGAYVHGRIYGAKGDGVKIFGRGVLTGRDFRWKESFEPSESHIGIGVDNGGNNTIDGIIVCDGAGHGINLGHDATYLRTKYWGWHPNNDGARPWGSNNKIDRCFIRSCDDALYNKGLMVTNTVFWPGFNGSILCLGWNGKYNTENSSLLNNYIIYPEWRSIGNNNGIVMSQIDYDMKGLNVTIKNLFIDGNIPALVNLHTNSTKAKNNDYDLPTDFANQVGYIDNILFENVIVNGQQIKFEGDDYSQTSLPSKGLIEGAKLTNGDTYFIKNVTFKNVIINNDTITACNKDDYFVIDESTSQGIEFEYCLALSVFPKLEKEQLTLYPNPAQNKIYIANGSVESDYTIYNQVGVCVKTGVGNEIHISDLSSGLYLISIDNKALQKFVKI